MYAFILFSYVCLNIIFFHHRMDSNITVYELKMLACFLDIIRCATFKLGSMQSLTRKKPDKLIRKKINITNKTEFSHGLLHMCQSVYALLA